MDWYLPLYSFWEKVLAQLTFTCSKLTIETLEKGVKYIQINNKNTKTMSLTSFWCFYCKLWTYFSSFSSACIVNFEQVNVSWEVEQVNGPFLGLRQFLTIRSESPLKMMKNAIYFTSKALFVLVLAFWSYRKTAWQEN